jgi:uncharacterized protein GlcG (DUF336 family)
MRQFPRAKGTFFAVTFGLHTRRGPCRAVDEGEGAVLLSEQALTKKALSALTRSEAQASAELASAANGNEDAHLLHLATNGGGG